MVAGVAVIAVPAHRAVVGVQAVAALPPAAAVAVSVQGAAAVAAVVAVAVGAGLANYQSAQVEIPNVAGVSTCA